MKNRLAVSVTAAILTAGLLTPAVFAANFSDVQGTKYQGSVNFLKTLGIVNGDANANYNPGAAITRAEFAKIAVEAAGLDAAANAAGVNAITGFYDVPVGHWAAGYVKVAKQHGLIQGYGDGTFGVDDNVMYEDVLTVLERLFGYTDASVGGYSAGYIAKGAALGLLGNVDFRQGAPATRGDVANLTADVLIHQVSGSGSTLLQQSFPTVSNVSGGITNVAGNNVAINGTVHNLTADSDVGADSITSLIGHKVTAFADAGNNLLFVADASVLPLPARLAFADSVSGLTAGTGNSFTLSALVVDADNHPIPGITVNFSSSSSTVAAVNASAVSNDSGVAQCVVTAGAAAGVVTITASTGSLSVSRQISVGSTISQVVVSGTSGVAVGVKAALAAVAEDANGATIPLAPGVVPVWNVLNGGGGAVIDSNGSFVATAAGTYQVTATINGVVSAPANIPVYGQAAGVSLSVNNTQPLIANNKSMDTVTVQVVDANGTMVSNFNGTVDISIAGSGGALLVGPNTSSYSNGVSTLSVASKSAVKISNGQGSFQIVAGAVPNQWVTIVAGNVVPAGSNLALPGASAAASVTTGAQTATSIRVNAPAFIGVNNGTEQAAVSTQILDQTGNPMLTGVYPVTLNLSGPSATFFVNNGPTSNAQSLTIGGGTAGTVLLQSVKGATGSTTITAVTNSLPTGTATINGVVLGQASQIAVSGAKNTILQGTSATLSAAIQDAAGNPAAYTLPGNLQVRLTNLDGTPAGTISASAIGTNGQFTVSAVNGVAAAGTYNVQVADASGALATSPAFPLTIASAPAAGIALSAMSAYLPSDFPATTVTAQLIDGYGNPVSKANQPISFSVSRSAIGSAALNGIAQDGTAATAVLVNTDATGKAAVNFSAQSLSIPYQVNASSAGLTAVAPLTVAVQQSVTNQLGLRLIDSQPGSPNYNSSTAAGGDALTIQVLQRDMKGNPVAPGENDSITMTISPALGLFNLPSSTLEGGKISFHNGVATLTGTVSDINNALASVKPGLAGTVSITAVDHSVPSARSASGTLNVLPTQPAVAVEAQTPNMDLNTYNVPYNTEAGPFTLTLVDGAGNPSVYPDAIQLTAAQVAQLISQNAAGINGLRLTLAGADLQTVTIPAGTSSLPVYVSAASGSYKPSAPRPLSSLLPQVAINDPGALGDASITGGLTVTGSVTSPQAGDSLNNVTVTLTDSNGTSITGAVSGTSRWSAYFSAADVAKLTDGSIAIAAGATTVLGNSALSATVAETKSTQIPVLVSAATASANTIALTYSKPLAPSSFLANAANGYSLNDGGTLLPLTAALSSADPTNKTVILTLPVPLTIAHGDSITVSYVQGSGAAVASAAGNLASTVSNRFVLNTN